MIFTKPKELMEKVAQNVIFHFSEIQTDITKGVDDFKAEKYYDSGNDFGLALVAAVGTAAPFFNPSIVEWVNWSQTL